MSYIYSLYIYIYIYRAVVRDGETVGAPTDPAEFNSDVYRRTSWRNQQAAAQPDPPAPEILRMMH